MAAKYEIVKKGSFVLISQGSYSDYIPLILCKAKIDLDLDSLENEYRNLISNSEKSWTDSYREEFIKWLVVDKNCVEDIRYVEWNLDDPGLQDGYSVFS